MYYEIGPQFDITIVNVFQFLWEFVPQTPYRGSTPELLCGLPSAGSPAVCRATFRTEPAPMNSR